MIAYPTISAKVDELWLKVSFHPLVLLIAIQKSNSFIRRQSLAGIRKNHRFVLINCSMCISEVVNVPRSHSSFHVLYTHRNWSSRDNHVKKLGWRLCRALHDYYYYYQCSTVFKTLTKDTCTTFLLGIRAITIFCFVRRYLLFKRKGSMGRCW